MRKFLVIVSVLLAINGLLLSREVSAQDIVYFTNGESVPDTRITGLTDAKVVMTVVRDGVSKEVSLGRSLVLLAFTKAGNYLLISELSADLTQAKQQIQVFLSAPPRPDGNDYLIKATPPAVIPARISYDGDALVNYKTLSGNPASISKAELVAILYRDGRHSLTAPVGKVAPMLADMRTTLANGGKSLVAPSPGPQPKPEPPVSPPATDTTTSPPVTPLPAKVALPINQASQLLSEEEKEIYRQKSLLQVSKYESYINIITDKSISSDDRDRAIEEAVKLFIPNTTVEVTSTARAGSRTMSVTQYLMRLKLLPYQSTKVEIQTQFVRDLTKADDGNYYGIIAAEQTFTGSDAAGRKIYSDVTDKNIRVKLQMFHVYQDGQKIDKWRVLLGNISVKSR